MYTVAVPGPKWKSWLRSKSYARTISKGCRLKRFPLNANPPRKPKSIPPHPAKYDTTRKRVVVRRPAPFFTWCSPLSLFRGAAAFTPRFVGFLSASFVSMGSFCFLCYWMKNLGGCAPALPRLRHRQPTGPSPVPPEKRCLVFHILLCRLPYDPRQRDFFSSRNAFESLAQITWEAD